MGWGGYGDGIDPIRKWGGGGTVTVILAIFKDFGDGDGNSGVAEGVR